MKCFVASFSIVAFNNEWYIDYVSYPKKLLNSFHLYATIAIENHLGFWGEFILLILDKNNNNYCIIIKCILYEKIEKIGHLQDCKAHLVDIYGVGDISEALLCKLLCAELFSKYERKMCHIEFKYANSSLMGLLQMILIKLTHFLSRWLSTTWWKKGKCLQLMLEKQLLIRLCWRHKIRNINKSLSWFTCAKVTLRIYS